MKDTATKRGSDLASQLSRVKFDGVLELISGFQRRTWSTVAVLLVRFSDDTTDLPSRDIYEQLFTAAGSGEGNNMVDFFADMSHGKLDPSGSEVFGWLELPVGATTTSATSTLSRPGS